MKCPYCNEEMQVGFIQCRDGVSWSKKKSAIAALASFSSTITLASGGSPFSGAAVAAYNCEKCKKIIIDYNSLSEDEN